MAARIVIIEDNPDNLDLMAYLLNAFGHTVLTACDGVAGLELVEAERPDAIICDLQMPRMDGYEVARQLKGDPRFRSIPLLAVTALAMVGDRDKVLAAGFDGYLAKPIDPEMFVKQVDLLLASHQRSDGREEPAPAPGPPVPPPVAQGTGPAVLVVDDSPANLALMRSTLEPFGYRLTCMNSVAKGLDHARKAPPDLIVSDVHMKDQSGTDFLLAAKTDPQLQKIPFVLITSSLYMREDERRHALSLGAARFISRPIEPKALLEQIQSCLAEKEKSK